jgi:DNA-binding MarR family transcriptional regulator
MDLATALAALQREVTALRSRVARRLDLTVQQAELLCQANHDSPSFGELARRLGCDKTNVTGMVDRLVQRGLLTRQPDPADRRVSRVVLTEEGMALGAKIRAEFTQEVDCRCGALAPADLANLTQMARTMAAVLAER